MDIAGIPLLTWLTMKAMGMPCGFYEWWICYMYVVYSELFGHSGVRVLASPPSTLTWLMRWTGTELVVEDHDLHHRKGWKKSSNYGKQTRIWDVLFGTARERIESLGGTVRIEPNATSPSSGPPPSQLNNNNNNNNSKPKPQRPQPQKPNEPDRFRSNGTAASAPDVQRDPGCSQEAGAYLLAEGLELAPCESIDATAQNGALRARICRTLVQEAQKCREKTTRGPCGEHHVIYNLRKLRDFVAADVGS